MVEGECPPPPGWIAGGGGGSGPEIVQCLFSLSDSDFLLPCYTEWLTSHPKHKSSVIRNPRANTLNHQSLKAGFIDRHLLNFYFFVLPTKS